MKNIRILIYSLFIAFILASCGKESSDMMNTPDSGKGGSMARFTTLGDFLYVVDDQNLKIFNIQTPETPVFIKEVRIGLNIETIFPYKNYLFIGSSSGMYIYSVLNPENPVFYADFAHVMSCDPVVANDSFAYVTLRSGGDCRTGFTTNQLEILDITDMKNVKKLIEIPMPEPWGLSVDGRYLFICHGKSGLGVYDVANPNNVILKRMITGIETYDVITHNKYLFVIGKTGFYQYDYSDINNIILLSQILVGQ